MFSDKCKIHFPKNTENTVYWSLKTSLALLVRLSSALLRLDMLYYHPFSSQLTVLL